MYILEVYNPQSGLSYTYEAEILQDDLLVTTEMQENQIGMGSLTLRLCMDIGSQVGLVGAMRPCALPMPSQCEGFRARLMHNTGAPYGGYVVIDGMIKRTEPVHDEQFNIWSITIITEAERVLIERLREIDISTLSVPLTYLLAYEVDTDFLDASGVPCYKLSDIWAACMTALSAKGATLTAFPSLRFDQKTPTGIFTRYFDPFLVGAYRNETTEDNTDPEYVFALPKWTGETLFELVQQITGTRFKARWTSFPNCNVDAITLEDRLYDIAFPQADAALLTSAASQASGTMGKTFTSHLSEPIFADFALAYENELLEKGIEGTTLISSLGIKPEDAYYYADEVNLKDGQIKNENVVRLPVSLPQFANAEEKQRPFGTTTEDVIYATPIFARGANKVYMFTAENDGAGLTRMVVMRKWNSGASGTLATEGEAWARSIARRYEFSRSTLCVIDAAFGVPRLHSAGLSGLGEQFKVGDFSTGVQFAGSNLVCTRSELNTNDGRWSVSLVKINTAPNAIEHIQSGQLGTPQNFFAWSQYGFIPNQYQVYFTWSAPTFPATPAPSGYRIEHWDGFQWNLVANVPATPLNYNYGFVQAGTHQYRIISTNPLYTDSNPNYFTLNII